MDITEYINRCDNKINPYNFSVSDMLVLTALSYCDFYTVSDRFNELIKLSEAANDLLVCGINVKHMEFLKALRDSKRFSELYICGRCKETGSSDSVMQFSAITIKISDFLWFVSYRGTDGTIDGWKEDFQFSYLDQIPSQKRALNYLNSVAANLKGKLYVSGHSKGGNLAAYASVFSDKQIQDRIIKVFCNDAPGFNEKTNFYSTEGYERMKAKIKCFIPQDSIIGQLLQIFPKDCYKVIHSNSPLLLRQHDIFTWQINVDGEPCWENNMNSITEDIMQQINDLIRNMPFRKRKEFTDWFFDILNKQDIRHVETIKKILPFNFF